MDILQSLHPLERRLLPVLKKTQDYDTVLSESDMKEVEVLRALQWLSNKDLLELKEESKDIILLDSNGERYAANGLPERRFLETLKKLDKTNVPMSEITEHSGLDRNEMNICIGTLKKKFAVDITKEGKELRFTLTDFGKKLLDQESLEEKFLKNTFPKEAAKLSDEEKYAYDELKKRKQIIKIDKKKDRTITLTKEGKKFLDTVDMKKLNTKQVGKLTPEMITKGKWKNADFRPYDVKAHVPKTYPGKAHFVNQSIRYIKQIWLELGFKEMTGDHIHTAFRDLDTLFVPQDHPAREMQDTFYIDEPGNGKLPKELFPKVKAMHEHGGDTSSKGWQYGFSEDVARMNLLRTHTTVLSAETIEKLDMDDLPQKFFAVGKVYRNEALDWKHLFEFHQVEGIVIDPDANLQHLIGYLTNFYQKLGYTSVRVRPAHFPYTEPSLEVEAFHPVKNEWIELGGAGIFRPEVVIPLLGKDVPVLAWGQGLERGVTEYFNITDLRDIYRNDIRQMKEMRYWMK
ncbi:MAG: phenylalanine--tRNA ligase subunit alpha [Nanoarchaeota archaeon]